MEPKLPEVNSGSEKSPDSYGPRFEQAPLPPTPEIGIQSGVERVEQRAEATPAAVNSMPALPPLQVAPAAPAPTARDDSALATSDNTPLVASDDDLIEKEWVDKAKKIITQTKDDPYRREQEVNKLQAEYLRKRYGRELGTSQ